MQLRKSLLITQVLINFPMENLKKTIPAPYGRELFPPKGTKILGQAKLDFPRAKLGVFKPKKRRATTLSADLEWRPSLLRFKLASQNAPKLYSFTEHSEGGMDSKFHIRLRSRLFSRYAGLQMFTSDGFRKCISSFFRNIFYKKNPRSETSWVFYIYPRNNLSSGHLWNIFQSYN